MTPSELFAAALQLAGTGWRVTQTQFQGEPPQLELHLEQGPEGQFLCPECERDLTHLEQRRSKKTYK